MIQFLFAILLSAGALFAQPRIDNDGIVNAASYSTRIAQGSMIVIFGAGLGPATLQSAPTLPLPAELAGTRVRIGSLDAFMIYTSARQVAAIVPSAAPVGAADVTVTFNGQTSPSRGVNIAATDFGIFTRNSGGYGPGVVQNFVSATSTPTNGLTAAANPGQTLIVYGSGLGAIDTADNVAPGVKPLNASVQVIAGGRTVTPTYAGRSPNFPALDQVNFVLPADIPPGCYIPVAVRVGNRISNTATIAVRTNGSVCEHPYGLDESTLRRLDAGQTITLGNISVGKFNFAGLITGETADALFGEVDANSLYIQSSQIPGVANSPIAIDTSGVVIGAPGTCSVLSFNPQETTDTPDLPEIAVVRALDAGAALRLSGPGGKTSMLTKAQGDGKYEATLSFAGSNFLQAGRWELSGQGGPDIGVFTAAIDLPEPMAWSNKTSTVSRSQPFAVSWTGSGGNDMVLITGISFQGGLLNPQPMGAFVCTALASSRTFSVPANIVSQLAAGEGAVIVASGGLGPRSTIPLTRGGNLDFVAFTYFSLDSGLVRFQ
jgi:uncharacterized protein (TIGR03437 family)